MTHYQTAIARALGDPRIDLPVALAQAALAPRGVYQETALRKTMRSMLDAAHMTGAVVNLGFVKVGGEVRYMACRPSMDADPTNKYYTVLDLELTESRGNPVYRRINLDAVVAANIAFNAAGA